MAAKRTKRRRQSGAPSQKSRLKPVIIASRVAGMRLAALPAAALFICAYTTYAHYQLRHQLGWRSALGGVAPLSCDPILLAPWGGIGPVPLAALGVGLYGTATFLAMRRIRRAGGLTTS